MRKKLLFLLPFILLNISSAQMMESVNDRIEVANKIKENMKLDSKTEATEVGDKASKDTVVKENKIDEEIKAKQDERNRLSVGLANEKKDIEVINGIPDDADLDNLLLMELKDGIVIIQLFPDIAPWHVYRIKLLTAEGFYDKLPFHRVLDKFMAQTGDPNGDGTGGSKYGPLQAEIGDLKHQRGTVSMARANDLDSANSQFFIVLSDKNVEHLDNQYTIFGRVLQGMEIVDKIKKGDIDNNGLVKNPDKILRMRLGQEMNYNYEGDSEVERIQRKKERVEILRNLKDFKKLNDQINTDNKQNNLLLDKVFELNSEL